MNEPTQLSHFLEAYENDLQPHCYGKERGWCVDRSGFCCYRCLGTRKPFFSKYVFSRHIPCPATTLTYRPNCQTGRPRHRGTATQGRAKKPLSMPSFPFFSSLATSDYRKTHAALLTPSAKPEEKGTLSPSWATLPVPTSQDTGRSSLEGVPRHRCSYSLVPCLRNAQCARHCCRCWGDHHEHSTQEALLWWLQKHSTLLNNSHQQWPPNQWHCNKITRNPKVIL